MVTVEIPREYGYVILSAVSTVFIATWHGMRVVGFRKNAKIPYPYEYASYEQVQTAPPAKQHAMYLFNCAQRAHQNFNENYPAALVAMMFGGIGYPKSTAALSVLWSVNRVIYAVGYTKVEEKGEKKGGVGRYYGILWNLAHLGMAITAAMTGYNLVMS